MSSQLAEFVRDVPAQFVAALIVLAFIAVALALHGHAVRAAREYTLTLLQHGLSVDEVVRLTARRREGKTLLEQFAAQSGGAKAGLIIGTAVVLNMALATLISVTAIVAGGRGVSMVEIRSDVTQARPLVAPNQTPGPPSPMPAAAVDPESGDWDGCWAEPLG